MSNREAIEILNELHDQCCQADSIFCTDVTGARCDAVDMAISALSSLEIPNSSDTIYRQDVIELVKNSYYNLAESMEDTWAMVADVERLPPAKTEIIRCTECKHYREYDSEYVENAVVVQCMADRYPISEIIPDGWFCAGAERKDDE